MASTPSLRADRRNDIQGIRVIGALLVFSFHVFFSGVSGGVDVFFVISGYFMASNAVKRGQLEQLPSLLSVYRNFLLRVAPQAIVALLGILLLLFFFISPMVWTENLRDVGASAVYLENWRLIRKGQDYLARSETVTLAQHFWAVSLIGQTYFLWPWLLRLGRLFAQRLGSDPRRTLTWLISALSALSLAWSLYFTHASPTSAYFDFFARFWEFGCGVLLGLRSDTVSAASAPRAALMSWIGIALLVSCGFVIGSHQAFPGYAALWPVLAAMALIRYGRPAERYNVGWLLARPWFARWGEVSFGVYLWHWPLYVVYQSATHQPSMPLVPGLLLLVLAFICALLGKKLVDWLFASPRVATSKRLVPLGFLSLLLLISTSSEVVRRGILAKGPHWDSASASTSGFIAPGPFSVRDDNAPTYKTGCHQSIDSPKLSQCSFGPDKAAATIVLVGGSHSAQWLPALMLHAEKKNWKIVSMTKSGCLFGDPADKDLFKPLHASCAQWNEEAMKAIVAMKPDLVMALATRHVKEGKQHVEYVPDGYADRFKQLGAHGIRAVALRDNPWMDKDVPVCVYSPAVDDKNICGNKRENVLNDRTYAETLAKLPDDVSVVDMTEHFCDTEQCWATKDDMVIYRDSNHITATYAEAISPALRDAVDDAMEAVAQNDDAPSKERELELGDRPELTRRMTAEQP